MSAGDCFVVISSEELFWSGDGWTPKKEETRRFDGPLDPYTPCRNLADRLRLTLGVPYNPAYAPRLFTRFAAALFPFGGQPLGLAVLAM